MHLQPLNKTIHSLSPANGNITLGKTLCHKPNLGLCLSPYAKQLQNPCILDLTTLYQDLSKCQWPVKKAIADLPISMKGMNFKYPSGNLLH